MTNNINSQPVSKESTEMPETPAMIRIPYQKPVLEELGDLRTLTLGGSPGGGDSGSPGTQNIFIP